MEAVYLQNNPFTLVEKKLWELLERVPALTEQVAEGNRIKLFKGNLKAGKNKWTSSDFPELKIYPNGSEVNITASSHTVQLVQSYNIILTTSKKLPSQSYFPLKWILYKSCLTFKDGLKELGFVQKIAVSGVGDSPNEEYVPGWGCVVTVDVRMVFSREKILESI